MQTLLNLVFIGNLYVSHTSPLPIETMELMPHG